MHPLLKKILDPPLHNRVYFSGEKKSTMKLSGVLRIREKRLNLVLV